MDTVTTAKALHLASRTLCSRFDVATSLVGTDEIASALGTDPLACNRVVLEAIKVGLGMFNFMGVGQGDKDGETTRRVVGVAHGR